MNRRTFLGTAGTAMLAATSTGFARTLKEENKEQGLQVRFLGTGAADWAGPDDRGEHRRLSSILIDRKILIDFTPTDEDMLPADAHPDIIFYTHSHGDHYNPAAALKLGIRKVYLSQTWFDFAQSEFAAAAKETGRTMPEIIPLCIGSKVTIDDTALTPLPANHGTAHLMEQTLIYLIEKEEVRVLYATDTGGIPAIAAKIAGIDAHYPGKALTGLIMEATMGLEHEIDFRLYTHSSVALVARTVKVLTDTKRYLPPSGQPVYLTHMARTLHGTQADLDKNLPAPLRAAYDGLEVVFKAK